MNTFIRFALYKINKYKCFMMNIILKEVLRCSVSTY